MNILTWGQITIPAVKLKGENPFPYLEDTSQIFALNFDVEKHENVYFNQGGVKYVYPYTMQDQYDRNRELCQIRAAILENDRLKAVFLPEYGCRLWSLYDKKENRELLFENPVLQPANLAIRNAWLAGGVEWNIGFRGHSPFTCAPLFCEEVTDSETGTPVLRFYEWERKRQSYYVVEAYLPDDRPFLMVRVKIKNCSNEDTYMYWWSNIAVPETSDTRTIVDADYTYMNSYSGGVDHVPVRRRMTYGTSNWNSKDYFYDIPKENRKFIAALDGRGKGLIQTSTDALIGRKLFSWGMCEGGRHWQDFLSEPMKPYLEIQAGLAKSQFECVPMKKDEEFEWLEAYGYMEADSEKVHGDWNDSKQAVRETLQDMLPAEYMKAELVRTKKSITAQKGKLLQLGSGWAYLENKRRLLTGEKPIEGIMLYEESITKEQAPWLDLLEKEKFEPMEDMVTGFMEQKQWLPLLEQVIKKDGGNWFSLYHLGLLYYANDNIDKAIDAFVRSCEKQDNAYAHYCLAKIETGQGIEHINRAISLMPEEIFLYRELFKTLYDIGETDKMISIYRNLSLPLQQDGRLKVFYMKALIRAQEFEECDRILAVPFEMSDIREGEMSLSEFWYELQRAKLSYQNVSIKDDDLEAHYPVPFWMNFNTQENV